MYEQSYIFFLRILLPYYLYQPAVNINNPPVAIWLFAFKRRGGKTSGAGKDPPAAKVAELIQKPCSGGAALIGSRQEQGKRHPKETRAAGMVKSSWNIIRTRWASWQWTGSFRIICARGRIICCSPDASFRVCRILHRDRVWVKVCSENMPPIYNVPVFGMHVPFWLTHAFFNPLFHLIARESKSAKTMTNVWVFLGR